MQPLDCTNLMVDLADEALDRTIEQGILKIVDLLIRRQTPPRCLRPTDDGACLKKRFERHRRW